MYQAEEILNQQHLHITSCFASFIWREHALENRSNSHLRAVYMCRKPCRRFNKTAKSGIL